MRPKISIWLVSQDGYAAACVEAADIVRKGKPVVVFKDVQVMHSWLSCLPESARLLVSLERTQYFC